MAHKHARNGVLATLAANFPPRDPIPDGHAGLEKPEKGSLAATVHDGMKVSAEERESEGNLVVDVNKTESSSSGRWAKFGGPPPPPASVRGEGWNIGDSVPADAKSKIRAIGRRQ